MGLAASLEKGDGWRFALEPFKAFWVLDEEFRAKMPLILFLQRCLLPVPLSPSSILCPSSVYKPASTVPSNIFCLNTVLLQFSPVQWMEGEPRINAINELNWVGSVFLKSHCHFDLFLQQPFCVHSWVKRIWDHCSQNRQARIYQRCSLEQVEILPYDHRGTTAFMF